MLHRDDVHGFQAPRPTRVGRVPLILGVVLSLAGCASMASSVTKGAVEGALGGLAQPQTQDDVEAIATSDEVQNAAEVTTASVTRGVVAGLTESVDSEALGETVSSYMDDAGPHIEAMMSENLAPGVAAIVRQSVDAALATAASEKNLARTQELVAATTRTAVRTATSALADGIREDLAPAISDIDTDAFKPAIAAAVGSDAVKTALGSIAYEMSRQTVLGSQAGLNQAQKHAEATDEPGLLGGLAGKMAVGWAALVAFVVALALAMVVLVVLLLKGRSQRRHLQSDSRQREELLLTLARSLASGNQMTAEQQQSLLRNATERPEEAA